MVAPPRRRPVRSAAGLAGKYAVRINRAAIGGPQPLPGGGPQFVPESASSPQAAPRILFFIFNLHQKGRSSPQPPLGRGLHFASRRSAHASPSARLWACPELGAVRQDRAGRSLRRAEARCSLSSQTCSAGCVPNWNTYHLILNLRLLQGGAAARSRPRAEGCNLRPAGRSCKPVRSAVGSLRAKSIPQVRSCVPSAGRGLPPSSIIVPVQKTRPVSNRDGAYRKIPIVLPSRSSNLESPIRGIA